MLSAEGVTAVCPIATSSTGASAARTRAVTLPSATPAAAANHVTRRIRLLLVQVIPWVCSYRLCDWGGLSA